MNMEKKIKWRALKATRDGAREGKRKWGIEGQITLQNSKEWMCRHCRTKYGKLNQMTGMERKKCNIRETKYWQVNYKKGAQKNGRDERRKEKKRTVMERERRQIDERSWKQRREEVTRRRESFWYYINQVVAEQGPGAMWSSTHTIVQRHS